MRKGLLMLAACVALPSCGGGGAGSEPVAVVPGGSSPTPSPTATPSPTSSLDTGEIKPSADAIFIAASMDLTTSSGSANNLNGQTTGGATANRLVTLNTPNFSGSYSATDGYRLADSASTVVFGPSQLVSDTTKTDKVYPSVTFSRVSLQTEDYLVLYKKDVISSSILGSGTITPRFGGIAAWQHTVVAASSSQTRLNYFAFGSPTAISAMPRTGVVKFTLVGSGNYARDADLFFMSQLDTLTVDFGSGTVSGNITPSGSNFFKDETGGLFGVTLAGVIDGNQVNGQTTSSVAVATGRFKLLFVGPNADELIVTYIGQDGRGSYVGSSVGIRNPYLP